MGTTEYVVTAEQMSIGRASANTPADAPAFINQLAEELTSVMLDHPNVVGVRLTVAVETDGSALSSDEEDDW